MNADILPLLPILLPVFLAALCVLVRQRTALQHALAMAGALALMVCSVELYAHVSGGNMLMTYVGNWVPPFGITIVADGLSAALTLTTSAILLAVLYFARVDMGDEQFRRGFYPLTFMLIAGVNGAFLTGDMFNLYVWFEVMLISSFSLLVLGRETTQIKAAIPYVTLNLIKTIFFLTSVGLLYGTLGTLNMADLHLAAQDQYVRGNPETLRLIAVMLILAFGIKAGMFPLYFWLPASYHTPSPAIGALFAALLTKVGVYAMLRAFTIVLPLDQLLLQPLLAVAAIATMLVPLAGAIADTNLRRILAFCLISHIGIMLAGLAILNHTALTGMISYVIHHMIVMACLFLLAGILFRLFGTDHLKRMGGLMEHSPMLSWLLFIPLIAISGLPPFSGFWGKMLLVKGGIEGEYFVLVFVMLLTGLLTLYAMLRIWHQAVWRKADEYVTFHDIPKNDLRCMQLTVSILAALSIWIGLFPNHLTTLSHQIATMLMDPTIYVDAVTGGST